MNYKAALFVMVGIAFLMSGCKAYSGYRNFTENVEIGTKNDENVLESDYEIKVFDKRLYAVQNKKVVYTQKIRIDEGIEWIYSEANSGTVIGNIITYPFVLIFSPLAILAFDTEEVEFEKNKYIYSYGRKVWNFFNIFARVRKEKLKEKDVFNSRFTEKEMLKDITEKLYGQNILIAFNNKTITVPSGTSLTTISQLLNRQDVKGTEIKAQVIFKNRTKILNINSGTLE